MIRTNLMKEMDFDENDDRGFGHSQGNVKVGPGLLFAEIQNSAGLRRKTVVSSWAATVGVVGWTLGGGLGPLAGHYGYGVDNLLEAEV